MISKNDLNGIKFGMMEDFPEYEFYEWAPEVWIFSNDYTTAQVIMGVERNNQVKCILGNIPVIETTDDIRFNPDKKDGIRTFTCRVGCLGDEYFETIKINKNKDYMLGDFN